MSWKGEWARERERVRERSTNNAHWVLWGSSWWDMQWPKDEPFRPGWGASHCPAFYLWKWMDGQCLSLQSIATQLRHHEKKRVSSPHPAKSINQSFIGQLKISSGGDNVNVLWKNFQCGDKMEMPGDGPLFSGENWGEAQPHAGGGDKLSRRNMKHAENPMQDR